MLDRCDCNTSKYGLRQAQLIELPDCSCIEGAGTFMRCMQTFCTVFCRRFMEARRGGTMYKLMYKMNERNHSHARYRGYSKSILSLLRSRECTRKRVDWTSLEQWNESVPKAQTIRGGKKIYFFTAA